MKDRSINDFYGHLGSRKKYLPLRAQIELTYSCNLDCIHCYCKDAPQGGAELTTSQWKRIIDDLEREGAIWLNITGGEPLLRKDFLEIYDYAKAKGLIISLMTNGLMLTDRILDHLVQSPPYAIEITLNGIHKDTYEAITGVRGSFARAMSAIKRVVAKRIPLVIKTNCLKQNQHEIGQIKAFAKRLIGKRFNNPRYFQYDPILYPRLNGDLAPTHYRISGKELVGIIKQDPDFLSQYKDGLCFDMRQLERERDALYTCNTWEQRCFINPYGRLNFCSFSSKFGADLTATPLRSAFRRMVARLSREKFKTGTKCRTCELKSICFHCPVGAYLETGDEEAPVEYYCGLAKFLSRQLQDFQKKGVVA